MATAREAAADLRYARIAKKYGMQNSLRIAWEARRARVPITLAYAVVEKETGNGRNVFGHDPTSSIPNSWKGTAVTKDKYRYYRSRRSRYGMQGVGPMQLTWYEFQDQADRLGGCWVPKHNIRVGLSRLGQLIRQYGERNGVRRYNGSGYAAIQYEASVRRLRDKWRRRLIKT